MDLKFILLSEIIKDKYCMTHRYSKQVSGYHWGVGRDSIEVWGKKRLLWSYEIVCVKLLKIVTL